ncbi:MAG: substrate-binding domain-containing protein [Planctomycetaceae bacterium]|nr:substrate-binding domain-containing protein [Planctomycetaceae bacterium]
MFKRQRQWASLALFLAALGCSRGSGVDVSVSVSSNSNTTTAPAHGGGEVSKKQQGIIGFSALTLTNPFFKIIAENMAEEAAKHGYEVIVDDANRDVKTQSEQIDTYITRGAAAIVINPCDRLSIGPAIKKANEAGIPVFTSDLQCVAEGAKITGHVGTDNFGGGKLAGEAMIEVLGEAGGKVLVLHFEQAQSCVLRVDGFREVIDAYNKDREAGKIEIVAQLDGGGLRDEGFKATSAAIQSDPDITGIFAINDPSALGAYAALEQAGKVSQVKIVAFDGQLDGKQAIKEGKIYADPIQFPDRMGQITVQNIVKYLNGEDFEQVTLIPTELYRKSDADKDPELK